jgi:hypothetical protein
VNSYVQEETNTTTLKNTLKDRRKKTRNFVAIGKSGWHYGDFVPNQWAFWIDDDFINIYRAASCSIILSMWWTAPAKSSTDVSWHPSSSCIKNVPNLVEN